MYYFAYGGAIRRIEDAISVGLNAKKVGEINVIGMRLEYKGVSQQLTIN